MTTWRSPRRCWPNRSIPLAHNPNAGDVAYFGAAVHGFSHGRDQLLPRNGDGHRSCLVGIEVARSRHRDLNRDAGHRDVHDDRIIAEIDFVAPAVGTAQDGVHRTVVSWYRQRPAWDGNSSTPAIHDYRLW